MIISAIMQTDHRKIKIMGQVIIYFCDENLGDLNDKVNKSEFVEVLGFSERSGVLGILSIL